MKLFRFIVSIGNQSFRKYLAISLLCVTGIIQLHAQPLYSWLSHLTVDDGLSSNRIRCVFRDSRDYLWMGTDVGLDKFDSYQIKKYRFDQKQPGTISNDIVTCIYEDRENNLWFGTYNGLSLYDPVKDNFKVFRNLPGDKNSLHSNCITAIIEDKKGILWIASEGNCLNKWDPKTQTFVRYQFDIEKNILNPRPSRMMAIDSKGFLWVLSMNRGLQRFDPGTGEFTNYEDPSFDLGNNCYKSIYIDNTDKIWIGTDGNGFFSFDPATNRYKRFGSKGDGKGTNQINILDILPEDDRHLLLAVDQGGINRFDKESETFEYIVHENENDEGLNNNGISSFFKDSEGIVWICTSGGGLNFYNPKADRFKLFRHSSNNPKSMSYSFTGCFYEDHLGMIWIGTDGGGVNVYNPETGNFRILKHEPSDPNSISGNVIRGIAEDKDHNVWIGTWDAGLNLYERKTGKFFHFLPDSKDPSSISGRTIWNLIIDHNNTLWVSIYNVGVDLFDRKKGVIRRFRSHPDSLRSISSDNSWLFFEDSEKKMWICTQNGLDLYDRTTNSFKVFHFPDNEIGAVFIDKAGYLWVGSNTKGLFKCNQDGTILKNYDNTLALPNNRIHTITQDNKGDIWISTNSGLSRLNTDINRIRSYSKEDGLQGDQFYQQSFLKTRKGELYFGGYSGFNSFFPENLKDNDLIPPVYITDLQIFNKPVDYSVPGGQFQTHISEAKEITLNWRQSVFSFSFVAINYTHPEKNKYAYILEGFEKYWNYTDASRRYVTYTNLDPGEYTFRVIAANNDGIWNNTGRSIRVKVLPPWWNTLWFRLIIISAIIFIIVSIFLTRIRQLSNQKILLEKTVAIKTSELKELNASKDKFFSIIAHDLKNPFNTIIGFSDILKEEISSGDLEKSNEYAEMINVSAVQTLRLLENLLEWANSQRGKISFSPAPIDLNELLNEEFILLKDMAIAKNIKLTSFISDELVIIADKNMFKTIMRNLISNAIKFTHANGKVEVNAMSKNKHVEVAVSDNGVGMNRDTISKLFRIDGNLSNRGTANEKGTGLGLFLCKEFIEKHGGKIWVESEEGKGSTFKFLLPLDFNITRFHQTNKA